MEEEISQNGELENQKTNTFQKLWQKYSFRSNKVKVSLFALLVALIILPVLTVFVTNTNTPENLDGHAQGIIPSPTLTLSNCQPNAILVNPCRPWIGAAAKGNPGIPGQIPPGKDNISQFDYLEQLLGRSLDIYRDYHSPLTVHNGNSSLPADPTTTEGQTEIQLSQRPNTYLDINWNPTDTWQQAMAVSSGGDPTINAQIDKVAANIKALSPHQIFLSPWWEANDHISSGTGCSHFNTTDGHGSPSQFVSAWQNIYAHFKADGVTNVVWVLDYASYEPNNCWVPQMWPGSQYVDWITYDTYSRGKTWQETAGAFYNFLTQQSASMNGADTKPLGIGEFGSCKQLTTGITEIQYYQSIKQALDANTYPRLKMYLIYADSGNSSGPGCFTDYDTNGVYDPAKQTVVNQLFNDPIFLNPGITSALSPTLPISTPTVTPPGHRKGKHRGQNQNQNQNN